MLWSQHFLQTRNVLHLPGSIKRIRNQDSYGTNISLRNMHFSHLFIYFAHFRYGGERYEKRSLQMRVRSRFAELQHLDEKDGRVPWHVVGKPVA
jgi:hypothetical protein